MRKLLLTLLTLSFSYFQSDAQITRAQFINNCSDVSLGAIDIYVNGVLVVNNLTYRTATHLLTIPALVPANIGIARGNSISVKDTFYNISSSFLPSNTYTMVANGIESTSGYSPAKPFNLDIFNMTKDFVLPNTNVEVLFYNGVTDAQTMDMRTGIRTIANDVSYGSFSSDYVVFPVSDIKLRLTNATGSSSFKTYNGAFNTLSLNGRGCIVLSSGFVDPTVNSNGPDFSLWVATTDGGPLQQLTETTAEAIARGQFIHNCADTAADTVDVYVDGTLVKDDFTFRTGTEFIDFYAKTPVALAVAPYNSTSSADAFYTNSVTLDSASRYLFVANGIVSDTGYDPKPAFTLNSYNQALEVAGSNANTDVIFMHGSTDAPAITITKGGAALFPSTSYGSFSTGGYQSSATANSVLRATTTAGDVDYEANFTTLGWQGRAVTLLASGFVDTSAKNSKGPLMGLYAVTAAGGPFVKLPVTTVSVSTIANSLQFSMWPNPTANELHIAVPGTQAIVVTVLDLNGKQVLQTNEHVVSTTRLPNGTYILQVTSGKETGYKTFVKQ